MRKRGMDEYKRKNLETQIAGVEESLDQTQRDAFAAKEFSEVLRLKQAHAALSVKLSSLKKSLEKL